MEKDLQSVLKENKEREQQRRKDMIARAKREQRKETILFGVIAIAIMTMTIMLLGHRNEQFVEDCTRAGYSESYCVGKA